MIGILLVVIAAILAIEMKSLLIGEGAGPEQQRAIVAAITGPGVESIIHLKTLHLGPEELLVAAKIAIIPTATATQITDAIDGAEQRIRVAVPIARLIYLEPDLHDPGRP